MKQFESLARCSDEELLTRYQAGSQEAFEALVHRYERELYGYLRRYLRDDNLAEDVFQNTFLQLYQKIGHYQAGRPVKPWLYTIATHQAIDALRRAGRRQTVSLDQARETDGEGNLHSLIDLVESRNGEPFTHLEAQERVERVRAALDQLPEHLRDTVMLAYYQGLKYREISEILGIPVGTVKSRLHVALLKLEEMWHKDTSLREGIG